METNQNSPAGETNSADFMKLAQEVESKDGRFDLRRSGLASTVQNQLHLRLPG